MASTATMGHLPTGLGICTTIPDILYLPELIFGGLVWILVACTYVIPTNPLGWVMFVSVFCFTVTFIWTCIFLFGVHRNSSGWATADFLYHFVAAFFYLSAAVPLALETLNKKNDTLFYYRLDISAVVFAYMATLLYFIHTIFSAWRWKSF
ncbi:hypothetical protein UPYG_G00068840 [Umbra pygmaea]|uniref:MARVEL domain-containing protein n=1 Tax=Umbra pygmaea TaxID=75934 RepID=A0ABD0XBC2_UMBPY